MSEKQATLTRRFYPKILLRLIVAVGLTSFVLWRTNPTNILYRFSNADIQLIGVAALLTVVDRILMAYRWLGLLSSLGRALRPPFHILIQIFFISTFVGTFLPASVGGEAFRAFSLTRHRVSGPDAIASVFMDRMMGVLSVLILGGGGLILARNLARDPLVLSGLVITACGCVAVALLIFNGQVAALAHHFSSCLPFKKLKQIGSKLVDAIQRYAMHRSTLFYVLICSIAVQIVRILIAYFIGKSLHIDASLHVYFTLMPLIVLIMLLPVTVSGIGTSQAAFVWFFGRVGVTAEEAFALSVIFVGLSILGNIPGGILYTIKGLPKAESARDPDI